MVTTQQLLALNILNYRTDASALLATQRANLKAYWPMTESSGTNMLDTVAGNTGTYSNVTLNSAAFADNLPTASFNGTTSKSTIPASMTMTGTKGACFIRAKVSAVGVWTDATARYLLRLQFNASNEIIIIKPTTSNTLTVRYVVAGSTFSVSTTTSTTAEFSVVMNYADGNNTPILQGWLNGVSMGTASPTGAFAGDPITTAFIGAGDATPVNVWSGTLGRCALWDTINLSATDVARLAL